MGASACHCLLSCCLVLLLHVLLLWDVETNTSQTHTVNDPNRCQEYSGLGLSTGRCLPLLALAVAVAAAAAAACCCVWFRFLSGSPISFAKTCQRVLQGVTDSPPEVPPGVSPQG